MKKIGIIIIVIILVSASFLSGCQEDKKDETTTTPTTTTEITFEEALAILIDKILQPGYSNDRVSAFMMSEKLQKNDVVTSEAGDTYPINSNTWFAFIDDDPDTFFSHPTRYVFINAQDGSYDITNEFWPPLINDISMWDAINMNRGNLVEIFPLLNFSVPISTGSRTDAPTGDYGDAPDGQNAYYGVQGRFPTLYNTTNSVLNRPGGHTLTVREEMLGIFVSAEVDANDPNDPDLLPNLVDSDRDERLFVILNNKNARLSFTVTVSSSAPDITRYVNVLVDFNQDGNWTEGTYGEEWAVKNLKVNVTPGSSKTIITQWFSWGNQSDLPSPAWIRVALTREKIDETIFSTVGGWDGSGQFQYGEIEDHLLYLKDNPPDPDDEWPPGDPKEPKDPQPPGSSTGPCGSDVNYHSLIINGGDSSKHMKKGQNPAKQGFDTMINLLNNQGYKNVGSLSPSGSGASQNSLSSIESAFDNLKSKVKCGDHVLIYIVGHGNPKDSKKGPGINLKGTNGKTNELLTPTKLTEFLGKIKACEDELCDVVEVNCHVTVVIESCYAGNFNIDGVKGKGRTVMGSCDDEPAEATGGGVFTSGFNDASQNEGSDTNDDDTVTPGEAFDAANDSVHKNNDKPHRKGKEDQEPWMDSQECECKCPNAPNITGGKYVWYDDAWVNEISVGVDSIVDFNIEITNDGANKNILGLTVTDSLPSYLSYVEGSAILYYNGVSMGMRDPCFMTETTSGIDLTWGLTEIPIFAPDETVYIQYSATTLMEGTYANLFTADGYCETDPSNTVSCEGTSTVIVI